MNRQNLEALCRPFTPVVAVILLGSCSYALGPYALIDGSEFPVESLSQIEEGMSPEQVQSLLGPPWRRKDLPAGERWIYYSRYQHRSCNAYLFGFLPVQRRPKDRFEANLEFGPEGLQRARLAKNLAGEHQAVELIKPGI